MGVVARATVGMTLLLVWYFCPLPDSTSSLGGPPRGIREQRGAPSA